jgi:hypothetical protein
MNSQGNRDPLQNEVEVRLTHNVVEGDDVGICDFKNQSGNNNLVIESSWAAVTITINAFDLISAIRDSILHIYTEGSDVQNMRNYFKSYPPLMAVVDSQN